MCNALGVPWVQAEGEAEACCAALASAGLVDGVATSDSDVLAFGTRRARSNGPSAPIFKELHMDLHLSRCKAVSFDVDKVIASFYNSFFARAF